jgi:hypothetical protein
MGDTHTCAADRERRGTEMVPQQEAQGRPLTQGDTLATGVVV